MDLTSGLVHQASVTYGLNSKQGEKLKRRLRRPQASPAEKQRRVPALQLPQWPRCFSLVPVTWLFQAGLMLQVLTRVTGAPWASEGRNIAQLLSQLPKLGPTQPKEASKIQASLFEKSNFAADGMAQAARA